MTYNLDVQNKGQFPCPIIFMKITPNEKLLVHCENKYWYKYTSATDYITVPSVKDQTWSQLFIWNNSAASIISSDSKTICSLNLDSLIASNCNFTTSSYIYTDVTIFNVYTYILTWTSQQFYSYNDRNNQWSPVQSIKEAGYIYTHALAYNNPIRIVILNSTIVKKYTFIYTYNSFWAYRVTSTSLYNQTVNIIHCQIVSGILWTQNQNYQFVAYDINGNKGKAVTSDLPKSEVASIIDGGGFFIFIFSDQIVEVIFNQTLSKYVIQRSSMLNRSGYSNLLPINTLNLTVLYTKGDKFLFPVKTCQGDNYLLDGDCVRYACLIFNCLSCPTYPTICDICNPGYKLFNNSICQIYSNQPDSNGSVTYNNQDTNQTLNNSDANDTQNNSSAYQNPNITKVNQTLYENKSSNNSGNSTQPQSNLTQNDTSPLLTICRFTQILNQTTNQCEQNVDFQTIQQALDFQKSVNSVPSFRIMFQIFSPIFVFFDDYWMYIYHMQQSERPLYLFFMQIFNLCNDKLVPFFIPQQYLSPLSSQFNAKQQRFGNYTSSIIIDIDKSNLYFSQKVAEMIEWNWQISVYMMVICKLFKLIFKKIKQTFHEIRFLRMIFGFILDYFEEKSHYLMLIVAWLEQNIISIFFYGTLQLTSSNATFDIQDQSNMICTILFLFVFGFYSCFFFSHVFKTQNKEVSETYLEQCKPMQGSAVIRTMIVGFKNAAGGFLHAVCLGNLKLLLPSMIIVKLSILYVSFRFRDCFLNRGFFCLTFLYYLYGCCVDLYILYFKYFPHQYIFGQYDFQAHWMIELSVLVIFTTIVILKAIVGFYEMVRSDIYMPIAESLGVAHGIINKIVPIDENDVFHNIANLKNDLTDLTLKQFNTKKIKLKFNENVQQGKLKIMLKQKIQKRKGMLKGDGDIISLTDKQNNLQVSALGIKSIIPKQKSTFLRQSNLNNLNIHKNNKSKLIEQFNINNMISSSSLQDASQLSQYLQYYHGKSKIIQKISNLRHIKHDNINNGQFIPKIQQQKQRRNSLKKSAHFPIMKKKRPHFNNASFSLDSQISVTSSSDHISPITQSKTDSIHQNPIKASHIKKFTISKRKVHQTEKAEPQTQTGKNIRIKGSIKPKQDHYLTINIADTPNKNHQ